MHDRPRHTGVAESDNNQFTVPSRQPSSDRLLYPRAIAALAGRLALTRPVAFIDLETTGVSVERDRIVELGIIRIEPTGSHCEFDRLVNPEISIPPDATAVHGITDAMVADAPTFNLLAPELSAFLTDCDVGGYNIKRFDWKVLAAEYARVGVACPLNGAMVIDPFLVFTRREARTLTGAMAFYCRVSDFEGHTAIDDARATICVLAGQLAKYPDLPANVEGLHEFCEQRDASWIDPDGKIVFKNGEAYINFGKFAGRTLRDLAKNDAAYLRWMITRDFTVAVKAVVGNALSGTFPIDVGGSTAAPYVGATAVPVMRSEAAIEVLPVQPGHQEDPAWPDVEELAWPGAEDVSCPDEPEWPGIDDATWWEVDAVSRPQTEDVTPADVDDLATAPVDEPAQALRPRLRLIPKQHDS